MASNTFSKAEIDSQEQLKQERQNRMLVRTLTNTFSSNNLENLISVSGADGKELEEELLQIGQVRHFCQNFFLTLDR
jgi:hypothetical protein